MVVSEPPGSSTQILHSPQSEPSGFSCKLCRTKLASVLEMKALVEPSGDPQPFPTTCPAFVQCPLLLTGYSLCWSHGFSLPLMPGPPQDLRPSKAGPCLDVASSASVLNPSLSTTDMNYDFSSHIPVVSKHSYSPCSFSFIPTTSLVGPPTEAGLGMVCDLPPSSWISSCSQSSKNDDSRS